MTPDAITLRYNNNNNNNQNNWYSLVPHPTHLKHIGIASQRRHTYTNNHHHHHYHHHHHVYLQTFLNTCTAWIIQSNHWRSHQHCFIHNLYCCFEIFDKLIFKNHSTNTNRNQSIKKKQTLQIFSACVSDKLPPNTEKSYLKKTKF